jgi:hypothetical protein
MFENPAELSQWAGAEFVALAMAAIVARGDRAAGDYQLTIARRFGVDVEGPVVDPERLPVHLIAATSGRLRRLLDRAAAADLKGGA